MFYVYRKNSPFSIHCFIPSCTARFIISINRSYLFKCKSFFTATIGPNFTDLFLGFFSVFLPLEFGFLNSDRPIFWFCPHHSLGCKYHLFSLYSFMQIAIICSLLSYIPICSLSMSGSVARVRVRGISFSVYLHFRHNVIYWLYHRGDSV